MKLGGDRYTNPYLAGAILGLVLFSAFWLTGGGLGASGGINRLQLAVAARIAPDHIDRNAYFAPTAGGNLNPLKNPMVPLVLGVLIGGFASGKVFRRVRVEVRKGPRISIRTRLVLALIGGVIMGWAARLARGCTSGQGLSGGAVLSAGSWAFLMAFFVGGYATAWFVRRLWNEGKP